MTHGVHDTNDAARTAGPATSRILLEARKFAASVLRSHGRPDLSQIVIDGGGDDFPEVEASYALVEAFASKLSRMEEALRIYADPDFWEDGQGTASLALLDLGEMARNVLAGRPPFYHRD